MTTIDRAKLTARAVTAGAKAMMDALAEGYAAQGILLADDPDWRAQVADAYQGLGEHCLTVAARHRAKAAPAADAPHEATIIQAGTEGWLQASPADGYLVQCPHGCNLGASAHAPDRQAAERRVELHRATTTPLGRDPGRAS